jgi:membrane-bound metal-dependent hydrolase YbcI (DUF457 family)
MPGYKEHLIVSAIINALVLAIFAFLGIRTEIWPLIPIFFLFTLLPDIDNRSSVISGLFYLVLAWLFLSSLLEITTGFNIASMGKMAISVTFFLAHRLISRDDYKHRAFPHSIIFGLFASALLFIATSSVLVTLVGMLSLLSHLIADGHIKWL